MSEEQMADNHFWNQLKPAEKLSILAGETTVFEGLLLEDETFVKMMKQKRPKQELLDYINENW